MWNRILSSSPRNAISTLTHCLLVALFAYSGSIKFIQQSKFTIELLQSPLIPQSFIKAMTFGVPLFEMTIVAFFLIPTTKDIALYCSVFLLSSFTFYLIALYLFFDLAPCSCGGILGGMSYPVHIAFNIFFTLVALLGIYTSDAAPTPKQNAGVI